MNPIAGSRLSPTDTLLTSYFFISFSKKYKATAQMYRLERCTNYIKKKKTKTTMEYFMHCFSVYNENKKGTFFLNLF